jgi:hypothetical protein
MCYLARPLQLFVECRRCGRTMTLRYSPARPDLCAPKNERWRCGSCAAWNEGVVPGSLIDVSQTHDDESPAKAGAASIPGITVSTACPMCHGSLVIALELLPSSDHLTPVRFDCPFCGVTSRFQSGRRIISVAAGLPEHLQSEP